MRGLSPREGFIVTNLTLSSRAVVRFYSKRVTAERFGAKPARVDPVGGWVYP